MNHKSVEYAQYKAQRIKELTPGYNRPGITILDFGCGSGAMTYYVQEVFFQAKVIGVDQSAEKIAYAQKKYPEIEFLPWPAVASSKTWDIIVAADVFHHIPSAKHEYWIQEVIRVLKPGGDFILLEPNPWNWFARQEFYKNPEEQRAQMLSLMQAKKLLKSFGKTTFYSFGLPWPFFYGERFLHKLPFGSFYAVMVQKER